MNALPANTAQDLLINHDRVEIRGLTLPFFIGIHDFEKARRQNVVIDVDIFVPKAVREGGGYVSYATVADHAITLASRDDHIELVETLATSLLHKALEDTRVTRARVRVMKSDIYAQAAGVGITIEGGQNGAAW